MTGADDPVTAILARERSRARMRVATLTVGAAALATAGVVAYNLPAPTARKATASTVVTPAPQPSVRVVRYYGDDGESGTRVVTVQPAGTTTAPSHTTSGGS